MADIDENLVAFLLADGPVAAITTTVSINRVPDNKSAPYIWIQLSDREADTTVDYDKGPIVMRYSVECTATNLDAAKDLQAAATTALDTHNGSFGDQNIAFAEVDSQDDSYETRQPFGDDENFHVASISLLIGIDGR